MYSPLFVEIAILDYNFPRLAILTTEPLPTEPLNTDHFQTEEYLP